STLVADHIEPADASVAATSYSGTLFFLALVWNGLCWYATAGRRLLGRYVTEQQAKTSTRQYYVAPLAYGAALLIAPFNGIASVAVILAVAGFFAITATLAHEA